MSDLLQAQKPEELLEEIVRASVKACDVQPMKVLSTLLIALVAVGGTQFSCSPRHSLRIVVSGKPSRTVSLHRQTLVSFRAMQAVRSPIDFSKIDQDLLDAAVFHETNRRRSARGLSVLRFEPRLRNAARIQAESIRRQRKLSHQNPEPGNKSLADRLQSVGLPWQYAAENVAMTFGVRYESGARIYKRRVNGVLILSLQPGGPPIPPHSYLSFAENLIDQWMDSPKHRKIILSPRPTHLGATSLHLQSANAIDRFYCAQVFYSSS